MMGFLTFLVSSYPVCLRKQLWVEGIYDLYHYNLGTYVHVYSIVSLLPNEVDVGQTSEQIWDL